MLVEVKMQLAYHLWQEKVSISTIAERLEIHRATVYRWVNKFRMFGVKRTIERHKESKKGLRIKRKLNPSIVEKILEVRQKYEQCCGEKLKWYLSVEYGLNISVATIYRYLHKETKVVKRYKRRNTTRRRLEATRDRQMIQVDTVDLGDIYAYTFIDVHTRQAQVKLKTSLKSKDSREVLVEVLEVYNGCENIQTDNGPEFKKEFANYLNRTTVKHRYSRAYKKNDQAHIESFNRTLRKECLGWEKYKKEEITKLQEKVDKWLIFYNNYRPHLGINMQSPNSISYCRI
jgi:IS30 family transposase